MGEGLFPKEMKVSTLCHARLADRGRSSNPTCCGQRQAEGGGMSEVRIRGIEAEKFTPGVEPALLGSL